MLRVSGQRRVGQLVELGLGDPGVLADPQYPRGDLVAGSFCREAVGELGLRFALLSRGALVMRLSRHIVLGTRRPAGEGFLDPGVIRDRTVVPAGRDDAGSLAGVRAQWLDPHVRVAAA